MLITKAKYIAHGYTARKAIWIKRFINEMRLKKDVESLMLYINNKMSIA